MDDTSKKLSDLDIFFENIVSDFQSHLERIEEIKLILNKMWNEVKGKKEKNSVSDLSHISQKDIDKILSGSKNDKQVPPYKSRDDENSISKDESVVMIKNLDFSGLENDKNFKKDKSYLGTNYRDQTINFSKIEKIDCINLKRKSNIL